AAGWVPRVDASGAAKLLITTRALRVRREHDLAGYAPVPVTGPAAPHAVAFQRGGVMALATRLPVGLDRRGGWQDTMLRPPCQEFADVLTHRSFSGPSVPIGEILHRYPLALLLAR